MSEYPSLGLSDSESRWIGIRRHQAVLVISGVGLIGDWAVGVSSGPVAGVVGALLVVGALPWKDSLTVGEFALVAVRFLVRSRWTSVKVSTTGESLTIEARGVAQVTGYELQHHGRLDLSGDDLREADALAALADAMANADGVRHVSLQVQSGHCGVRTLLALPRGTRAPEGWRLNTALVGEVVGLSTLGATWVMERWSHVRTVDGPVAMVRIRDLSAVPRGRALLESLQQMSDVLVALHFEVMAVSRAERTAARAVHRTGSDWAASRAVGFRRTARAERAFERLSHREVAVARGRALLRLGIYVRIRATNTDELAARVSSIIESAHAAGLRCERGLGRQALWYCAHLPGGPGW